MARLATSLAFWGFILVSSMVMFPIAVALFVVTWPFDRCRRALHLFTCFWASMYTWMNPSWPVRVEHRERLLTGQPTVMVANHLSLVDILVLFRLFTHFKWVSKVENFRVPFIGWNMSLNGYVPLKRGDRESIVKMMQASERQLAAGNSIMMFPEGTRSANARLKAFKTGAFELALKCRVPIQPIVLRGTAAALPKRGFALQGHHEISITVLEPISPESFAGDTVDDVTARVRALIAEELDEKALPAADPA